MPIESVMRSNHLILCHLLLLLPSIFPASGSFPMSQFFASGGQSIGASASASVLPMYIQGWFPLGLTGLISLLSKGLSRVFSSTTVQRHQKFGAQPSLWSNSHICTWLRENIALKLGYSASWLTSLGLAMCCDSVIKAAFSVHSAHLFNSIPWSYEAKLQKSREKHGYAPPHGNSSLQYKMTMS